MAGPGGIKVSFGNKIVTRRTRCSRCAVDLAGLTFAVRKTPWFFILPAAALLIPPCGFMNVQAADEPDLPALLEEMPQVREGPDGTLLEAAPDGTLWDLMPEEAMPDFAFGAEEDSALTKLALAIAPTVVSLRAWTAEGRELAARCGTVVSADGLVMTDISLVQQADGGKLDHISGRTGDGKAFRVAGVVHADPGTGVLFLKADLRAQAARVLAPGALPDRAPVAVMALHPERGLILADAQGRRDDTLVGAGMWEVTGTDSAAAVGSPVFDPSGNVAAVITHRIALNRWIGYAQPVTALDVAAVAGRRPVPPARFEVPSAGNPAKDPRFLQAFTLLREGKVRSGARLLLRLAGSHPRSAAVWSLLGAAATALGAHKDALACQRRAASLDPSLAVYWRKLAEAARRADGAAGSPDAMEAFSLAAREQPGDAAAWLGVAEGAIRAGDALRGAEAAQRAVQLAPEYARGYRLLGYCLRRTARIREAEAALKQCLRLDPRDGQAAVLLAALLESTNRSGEALTWLERAAERSPGSSAVWLKYARSLRRAGRDGEAVIAFRRYTDLESRRLPSGS